MSYEIRETTEGGLRVTVSHYKESENIVDIFPPCYTHDTTRSREARLDMVDAIIRNLEGVIREQIAQDIVRKMVCHCPSIEFFDDWCVHKEAAAIVRGTK
jgi:hypothetical protein